MVWPFLDNVHSVPSLFVRNAKLSKACQEIFVAGGLDFVAKLEDSLTELTNFAAIGVGFFDLDEAFDDLLLNVGPRASEVRIGRRFNRI